MPIPNIFGKVANMMLGQGDSTQAAEDQIRDARFSQTRREGREGIHSLLLEFRQHLLNAVASDIDPQPVIQGFVQLDVPLKEKYVALFVTDLLKKNSESVDGLKRIHSGLGTIIKYAKHLIRSSRQEQWGSISFKNNIVQRKILPLNGFDQVLNQLGYTETTDSGQSFPPGKEPNKENVVNLIADMELFRAELKTYCSGRHLHPESIGQYLPQELRDELEARQISDMSLMESSDAWAGLSAAQEAQQQTTVTQAQDQTKTVTPANQERNSVDVVDNGLEGVEKKETPNTHINQTTPRGPTISSKRGPSMQNVGNVEQARASRGEPSGHSGSELTGAGETNAVDESRAIPDLVPGCITESEVTLTGPDPASESPSDMSTSIKLSCSICGEEAVFLCRECYDNQMVLCENCNKSWHKRLDRRHHNPQPISRHYRLSLESSSSGHALHIDEDYGITAASKHSHGKQEQTEVVNVSKSDHLTQPAAYPQAMLDKGFNLPLNKLALDLQQQQHHQHHQLQRQQGLIESPSQYQPHLPLHSQVSPQTPMFQQGLSHHAQHLQQQQQRYQGYNNHFQQQQPVSMSPAYRMSGLSSAPYNHPVAPSYAGPSTPTFAQAQGMSMVMSSTANGRPELRGMPQQYGGHSTMAEQVFPTHHLAGMTPAGNQPTHLYMPSMPGESQGRVQPQFQQQHPQQKLPMHTLPPYIQTQLEQNSHLQSQGPRWMSPGHQAYPYHPNMNPNFQQPQFRPRMDQPGPRLAYPQGNSVANGPSMIGMPPSLLNHGYNSTTHITQLRQEQKQLIPKHQQLQYSGSVEQYGNHMDLSLQHGNTLDLSASTGVFPGLGKGNNDVRLGYSGLGGQNAQENYQHGQPLKHPYQGASDSSPYQSPFISAPSSPLSTPPPSTPASGSEYIKKLSMEPDLIKRLSLCDHFIRNISADMKALEEEMRNRMEGPGSFYSTPECTEMQRRMEEMVKEKKKLQSYKDQLNCQVDHFYKGIESGTIEQEIYYPPDVNTGASSKSVPTKRVNNGADSSGMNFGVPDNKKLLNVVIDNREPCTLPTLLPASAAPDTSHTTAHAGLASGSRVPVEDSISENITDPKDPGLGAPPALPPRSSKPAPDKDILAMTIPAPQIPRSPSPSSRMWVCEHCTFHNPINVHICGVCYRTTDNAEVVNVGGKDEEVENGKDESSLQEVDEAEEKGEKGVAEDREKDPFISFLTELRDEMTPIRPPSFDDDDDGDEELWETGEADDKKDNGDQTGGTLIGERIIGSQKQVMEEKKKAKKEFELREQERMQQLGFSASACPSENLGFTEESKSNSPKSGTAGSSSNTSSPSRPSFGVGARPKDTNRVPINIELTDSTSSNKKISNLKSSASNSAQALPPHLSEDENGRRKDSIEDSLARMEELKSIDKLQSSGLELTQLIKSADLENFDIQAVQIAIEICESMKGKMKIEPLIWLRTNWRKNVTKIASQASMLGKRQSPNSVGEMSFQEAEEAYISCQGNMKEAADKCVQDRQASYQKLSALVEDFPREEILEAMFCCKGDTVAAQARLVQAKLEPFANRIWQQQSQTPNTLGSSAVVSAAAITTTSGFTLQGMISNLAGAFAASALSGTVPGRNDAVGREGTGNATGNNAGPVDPYQGFAASIIGHQQFQDMIRDKSVDSERRVRMIYVEGRLLSWGRADMVIKILDQDAEIQNDLDEGTVTLEDIVEAVRDCQDRASALAYLRQECQICFGRYPMNKIHNLNICQCRLCQECLVAHFEVVIREKHVRHWVCPQCSQPDLSDPEVASNYLQFLGMQLQPMVSQDLRDLFETKFRDWHLQKLDYFRWCAHCAEGFLAENQGGQLRMTCPRCGKRTCYQCKKQWEDQHEGLTCEEYSQWKVDNDPTNQSVGLAKHLDENGIDCPNCKMRFALAKGGCMHFKCPQCGHEFCSGCNEAYHHKNRCTKYKLCKNLGLHCHCPRDCFSFLRDYTVDQLQRLLKQHNVPFNTAPPADQQDREHCPVVEQKEFDEGNRDEMCGRDAYQGGAGLCENHYKEYLVVLINGQGLDPVTLMTKDEMETLLGRYDLPAPATRSRDTPEVYKASLAKIIKEKLPLRKR